MPLQKAGLMQSSCAAPAHFKAPSQCTRIGPKVSLDASWGAPSIDISKREKIVQSGKRVKFSPIQYSFVHKILLNRKTTSHAPYQQKLTHSKSSPMRTLRRLCRSIREMDPRVGCTCISRVHRLQTQGMRTVGLLKRNEGN